MFAKLKKKIAEETAVAQRPGGTNRIPRSVSKESVASMGADSGDDFASDGSSSREDLSSQLLRRNEQIRKLEARLSDYAEQVRNLQKIKEKLEIALEKHQDSSMRKFQEQNETFQANRAKMAEGLALALARKDQEWSEKMDQLEKDKRYLTTQLQEMKNQSLSLFQKRDEIDELEGFQQQEMSKVKHMLLRKEESLGKMEQELDARTRELNRTQEELVTSNQISSDLSQQLEELQRHCSTLEEQRDHVISSKACAEHKIVVLEQKEQELQAFIQQLSIDLQKVTAETQEKEKIITHLQEKVIFLEKRLEQNLSGEDHVQELLKERTVAEQNLEDTRQQLLAARSSYTKAIDLLETRDEWSQREIVSVAMAQALEEVRKQREEFQQQAAQLSAIIEEKNRSLCEKDEVLLQKEQELDQLEKGHSSALLQMHQLQNELEALRSCRAQEAVPATTGQDPLESLVIAKAMQNPEYELQAAEGTPNGEVEAMSIEQLQKEKQDLEQQLTEKNKIMKQMQQRMLELKKTLQKELKIRPDSELFEVRERTGPEIPNMANNAVTNNADLTDAREINFEYLKHVVLKFMSCRESEAFHLIKAVSVLLNFSQEEENMLKETLEYKMSWFGSKPAPKGSIRPSISNPRIPWS
ncbi:golgin subfamily A member 1 isoform X4 [Microtus oregoni]|uniref:golgin subfamily A member 1 isoform X4 n=1 Tax=Microtus oregoni TaxID=111838 RepID=UPI001BB1A0D7|nr:golgin subfamily A member 1 isoform X4 [Microtus oregoni]